MELRHLKNFLAVVRHRNVGRAAEELNMTQPALSKSIRRLEQFLEVKLIERHPRGVEPTEFGKALAAHAELIDVEIRHTMNSIAALRGARQGHITVGAAPGSFTELLPQATTALLNRNPDLRVTVVGGLGDTLFAALKQGALDFVVSALPGPPSIRELAHEKLFMDRVTLVARVGHPLAQERRLSPRHLIGQKWVLPNPTS
jgi:LysR family transcriptional regulator, regulator of abg operon